MARTSAVRKVVAQPRLLDAPARAAELDRLIHDRVRLGIISALAAQEGMTFSELKKALNLTDGNLSVHARKLEEAGYITAEKAFVGRVPKTSYRLSEEGKLALGRYLNHMEALIAATRRGPSNP
ncbi:MAG: transcriptional regulator [Acidobacteria bacterium]|nr:transcriptional regulator [Acidobacteriota bacterium]